MYLKRIELSGFKSFADKTEFEFVPGITAVVGPNGSGKSNITDGMRWVFGEQSAKSLRGAKMEDVIFAGSDTRKPVNFSEVSLTLDNNDQSLDIDYSEVTITRRLYRTGESEYFINKKPCRLKDITELFMDTGLGKEAYSIIGQGKIEEILSSKPEDRRGIFEEAAGIVKYKARKKEAERKLDDTEVNLIRINDLISEIEGQIEPLEKQANIAKEYKEYGERLKEVNIKIYVNDIEKAYEEWQASEKIKAQLTGEQIELSSLVNKADSVIEKKRWSINQMEKELEELHKQLIDVSEKVEQTEGKKEVLNEREKNQHNIKTQTLQTIDKFLAKKEELQNQLNSENEKLNQVEEKINTLTNQLSAEEGSLNRLLIDHESRIETYKEEYFECLNEMANIRNEIRHLSTLQENLTYRSNKLKKEVEDVEKEKVKITEKRANIELEIANKKNEIEEILKEYSENGLLIQDLTKKQELQKTIISQEQHTANSLASRLDLLTEMQSEFSGFNQGVKEILKHRETNNINGIHGAVAELISVSKEYETAIETALGGSLQHIVVNMEKDAREAINFLKNKKLGRATFLPLEVIKGKKINNYELAKITKIDGFLGVASDLIKTESKYTEIIDYLLGQVIICSELKIANEIAKLIGYSKRIVTLDGDIVNPGGSMTGGSVQKKSVSILGRQREIEELTIKTAGLKKTIEKEETVLQNIAIKLQKTQDEKEKLRNKGEQKRLEEQELQSKQQQLDYEYKNIVERLTVAVEEIKQLETEIREFENKKQELETGLAIKMEKEIELKQNIEKTEIIRKQDESTKEKTNEKITNFKIELAKLKQEQDGNKSFIQRLSSELDEVANSLEQNLHALSQLENELVDQGKSKEDINKEIEQLRYRKAELQKINEDLRIERSRIVHEIENEEVGVKEVRKNLKNVESELHKAEVKLSRLDVELENLLGQLAEEYEVSYEWAKNNVGIIGDIELYKKEVKELKQKIQMLGEVNLGAIDEFARVSERFNFLTTQRDDLLEAKKTLYQVIKEVDTEMTKLFIESFEAIREHFQIVFVKLFGGGRADLILSDPNNLLDTGIDIVAQPPGKKLQNLALLSGGEKALTALSLLFAVLRVKPVPFCVLDEVEAALDEANISKFVEYLREFIEQTQFIVVTHRKGTMEGADVLYGVTMQESGVSRLVSVKLEDKEQLAKMA